MANPASINPRIIEGLYCEALVLSDEVRAAFDLSGRTGMTCEDEDLARVALSCEALRTTTRMMHSIAWLLNHRAHLRGELSEFQLRRHGRLATDFPAADPDRLAMLDRDVRELIQATERFYARLVRLESGWRHSALQHAQPGSTALARLRERLGASPAKT